MSHRFGRSSRRPQNVSAQSGGSIAPVARKSEVYPVARPIARALAGAGCIATPFFSPMRAARRASLWQRSRRIVTAAPIILLVVNGDTIPICDSQNERINVVSLRPREAALIVLISAPLAGACNGAARDCLELSAYGPARAAYYGRKPVGRGCELKPYRRFGSQCTTARRQPTLVTCTPQI